MTSKELAFNVLRKLVDLADMREMLNGAYGDDRGAFYEGSMEDDIKKLAQQVRKEKHGPE